MARSGLGTLYSYESPGELDPPLAATVVSNVVNPRLCLHASAHIGEGRVRRTGRDASVHNIHAFPATWGAGGVEART